MCLLLFVNSSFSCIINEEINHDQPFRKEVGNFHSFQFYRLTYSSLALWLYIKPMIQHDCYCFFIILDKLEVCEDSEHCKPIRVAFFRTFTPSERYLIELEERIKYWVDGTWSTTTSNKPAGRRWGWQSPKIVDHVQLIFDSDPMADCYRSSIIKRQSQR